MSGCIVKSIWKKCVITSQILKSKQNTLHFFFALKKLCQSLSTIFVSKSFFASLYFSVGQPWTWCSIFWFSAKCPPENDPRVLIKECIFSMIRRHNRPLLQKYVPIWNLKKEQGSWRKIYFGHFFLKSERRKPAKISTIEKPLPQKPRPQLYKEQKLEKSTKKLPCSQLNASCENMENNK